jgi:hypothetical protein
MMERNRSDCKYVEIFTHHVGSLGAPSRGTVFRGTNAKSREVSNIIIIIIILIIITM